MSEDAKTGEENAEKRKEEEEVTLLSLLLQSQNTRIHTRNQHEGRYPDREDNPGIAPGWNALMIQDLVAGMFMMTAAERTGAGTGGNPPHLSGEKMESAVPGFPDRVRRAAAGNLISNQLRRALHEEVRELACQLVHAMTPEERDALLRASADSPGRKPGEQG